MEITDVRIRRIDDEGKMKAVASITFDGEFVIHDIKIVSGKNGMFVAMPSKKIGQSFKDVAHPLSPETRAKISNAIFKRYEEVLMEKDTATALGNFVPTDENAVCEEDETIRRSEEIRTDTDEDASTAEAETPFQSDVEA